MNIEINHFILGEKEDFCLKKRFIRLLFKEEIYSFAVIVYRSLYLVCADLPFLLYLCCYFWPAEGASSSTEIYILRLTEILFVLKPERLFAGNLSVSACAVTVLVYLLH